MPRCPTRSRWAQSLFWSWVPWPAARASGRNRLMKLFYGWVIVGAGIVVTCIGVGAMLSLAIFLQPMSEAMGWSRTGISTAALLNWLCMGVGSFLWGALTAEKHDGARAEPVGERAPEERADAHTEPVEERGRRDPRARPAHRLRHGLEEDGERKHRADPDAGHDDPRTDDDPAIEELHESVPSARPSRRPWHPRPEEALRPSRPRRAAGHPAVRGTDPARRRRPSRTL